MAAWGYEFYLLVLKVSLSSERSERVRDTFNTRMYVIVVQGHCTVLKKCKNAVSRLIFVR